MKLTIEDRITFNNGEITVRGKVKSLSLDDRKENIIDYYKSVDKSFDLKIEFKRGVVVEFIYCFQLISVEEGPECVDVRCSPEKFERFLRDLIECMK